MISDNDPDTMEKIVKFNELLANCLIFHTSVDMMRVLNQLQHEDHELDPAHVATLSSYLTRHVRRQQTCRRRTSSSTSGGPRGWRRATSDKVDYRKLEVEW